jgi:NADPH:quinone reductase-like Zn-dependent oxidoreductase
VFVFAVQFDRFGPPDVLSLVQSAEPHAGPGQVRIRVKASGISPVDLAIRAGTSPSGPSLALPHIPGVDAAGIVDEIGEGVTGVSLGDEVFGTVEIAQLGGAAAEFAVLAFWARKPGSMAWIEAGAAGSGIETATRVLELLDVRAGETVLVDGAAGGVGSIVVQLAIASGARVVGTASEANLEFLAGLGAVATTYGPGLPERIRELGAGPISAAVDVAGRGSLPELIELAGSADHVVTIADFGASALGVRISMGELAGQPSGKHGLEVAARLFEAGRFRVPVQNFFPFERAAEAHALASAGPRQGKVVLVAP